jgi:hypothetical protein
LLFAEIQGNPNGAKFRHRTAKDLLRRQQLAFSTAKSTRFGVDTANSKSPPTVLVGLQQCV